MNMLPAKIALPTEPVVTAKPVPLPSASPPSAPMPTSALADKALAEEPPTSQEQRLQQEMQPMKIVLPGVETHGSGVRAAKVQPVEQVLMSPVSPSTGSGVHGSGNCRPCAWFWKPGGCQNGEDCNHCHLCPEDELKMRKKHKLTMMRLGLATPKAKSTISEHESPAVFGLGAGRDSSGSEPDNSSGHSSQDSTIYPYSRQESHESAGDSAASRSSPPREVRFDHMEVNSEIPLLPKNDDAGDPSLAQFPPGLEPLTGPPSRGSALHSTGSCRPCAWYWKQGGCQNDRNCAYCHLCSEGELKVRKKSKLAMMRLGLATPQAGAYADDAQEAKYALSLVNCL